MPNCYTCQEEIIFDKHILSKTGKQIPLWPDKQNTHAHDENGKPIRGLLPSQNLTPQQTEQFNQYNKQQQQQQQQPQPQQRLQVVANKTAQMGTSSGGSYMDTKRIRVMLEEHTKEIQEMKMMLNEILNARTILDTNRYEGKNDQIYNVIAPFLNTQGVVASELLKDKQQQRDPLSINHGKIADLNETREKAAAKSNKPIVDESRERIPNEDYPIEETLKDDEDDDDTKGVIDDL